MTNLVELPDKLTVRVNVTQKDIDTNRHSALTCPVAIALKRAVHNKGYTNTTTSVYEQLLVHVAHEGRFIDHGATTPPRVLNWIKYYDSLQWQPWLDSATPIRFRATLVKDYVRG